MRGKQKVNKASGRKFRTSPLIFGDESDGVGESQVDESFPLQPSIRQVGDVEGEGVGGLGGGKERGRGRKETDHPGRGSSLASSSSDCTANHHATVAAVFRLHSVFLDIILQSS